MKRRGGDQSVFDADVSVSVGAAQVARSEGGVEELDVAQLDGQRGPAFLLRSRRQGACIRLGVGLDGRRKSSEPSQIML